MLVFEERGKPEYPEKNLSEQMKEPTTNSTHKNSFIKTDIKEKQNSLMVQFLPSKPGEHAQV